MSLSCICPKCGKRYSNIKLELAGKKVRCSCGHKLRLPQQDSETESTKPRRNQEHSKKTAVASRAADPIQTNPFDLDYDDLDQILARDDVAEEVLEPTDRFQATYQARQVESQREPQIAPLRPSLASSPGSPSLLSSPTEPSKPTRPANPSRLGLWLLLTLVSATLSAWLGSMLIAARFVTTFQHPLLDWFVQPLGQIYRGDFGLPALTYTLQNGFTISGWVILSLAAVLILMGLLLYVQALIQLFSPKQWFAWIDGWLATISFLLMLVLIGTLFLNHSHTINVNREIQSQVSVHTSDPLPPQLERLKQELADNERMFQNRIFALGIFPTAILVVSMLRLFVRESWTLGRGLL